MDEAAFAAAGTALVDAVTDALPAWGRRVVLERAEAWGADVDDAVRGRVDAAAAAAADRVGTGLRELLAADVDAQRQNPLAVIRAATGPLTDVLAELGVGEVVRDPFVEERFPDDPYDLGPAGWADLGDDVLATGLAWGAAKARLHRRRHGSPPS